MKKKQKKNLLLLFVLLVAGIIAWFAYSRLLYPTETALGMFGPLRMMLCKPDLSDKHERWFRINADDATLEWAAQATEGGLLVLPTKGPFRVRPPELVCTANALLTPLQYMR